MAELGVAAKDAAALGKASRVLCWLRQDLRCHDNAVLAAAASAAASAPNVEVLPVFCFQPSVYNATLPLTGLPKTGARRAKFMRESVADLKQRLRAMGSELLVAVGEPEDVFPELMEPGSTSTAIITHAEACTEELDSEARVEARATELGGALVRVAGGFTLYDER